MAKKNTVKCCLNPQNQFLDSCGGITGLFMEIHQKRRIENDWGGFNEEILRDRDHERTQNNTSVPDDSLCILQLLDIILYIIAFPT